MRLSFKNFFSFFVLLLFFVFFGQVASGKNFIKAPLGVFFLNVGQGDAVLINYLNRYQILIDGGPDGKKLMNELGKVMPRNDRKIEIIILTHPDWDHFGGLIDLFDYYNADSFLTSNVIEEKESFQKLIEKIRKKNIPINLPESGSRIDVGNYLALKILSPNSDEKLNDDNDNSIITRLDFGENSFLFMGDAGEKKESLMVKNNSNLLDIDWLKVGHHGSKNATSSVFLEKTTPRFAIISVGKENNYGHPSEECLKRLNEIGTKTFRTDQVGSVFVECRKPNKDSCFVTN